MIIRIVKMTIQPEKIDQFNRIFNDSVKLIQEYDGCLGVQLMKDVNQENVYFTISKWQTESHLNIYRKSKFFGNTWSTVKVLFAGKAEAWSLDNV